MGYNQIKGRILINMEIETPQMVRCLLGRLRSELGFYKEFERRCPDIAQYVSVFNFCIPVLCFETLSVY